MNSMALSNKSTQSKIFTFRNFVFGMILGGGVYLILIILSNWEQLLEYLGRIPVEIIIIAMGLSFLNYLCRFAKWLLFTKSLQLSIPLLYNFKVFMWCLFTKCSSLDKWFWLTDRGSLLCSSISCASS